MSENNVLKVTDNEGRPTVIIYETQSGVLYHITPLSLPTLRAIQLKAADRFPYPDKKPYQVPDPVEVAFSEGQVSAAEDNPDYIAACREVDSERARWVDRAIFDYAAHCPKYPTKEALVMAFKAKLENLREIANLPDDDYEAVLFHLVLTWNQLATNEDNKLVTAGSDYIRIIQLAIQTVALTPDEVTAGIRFFRPRLSERRP